MKTSENLTIIPPEGMESYQEGNEIKFRPIKKKLTYEDVAEKLFALDNKMCYIDNYGHIELVTSISTVSYDLNNCTSEKQARKLLAINQLMNVAKYLNGDWQPDWNNRLERKSCLYVNNNELDIYYTYESNCCMIYFKTKELAQQAIDILGEETIKLALSTDW